MNSQLRILLIDDNAPTRKVLREILTPLRAEVIEASNGQEGLNVALQKPFDLIITDIDMPHMSGIDFCQHLKNTPETRSIPVIMVSAFDSASDMHMGFHAGASAYTSKREARTTLLGIIKQVLSKFHFQSKQLILVVDDSRYICRLVEEGLEQAGFQVITAKNGKAALELVKAKRPHLILSDLDMPEMDGFDFCTAIHADPEFSAIPFVVMSTISDRGHMKRIIQQGASGYIVKPFNIDELVIYVERFLSDQFQLLLKERERLDTERFSFLASISSLISALEARDSYTRGHSETVADILFEMATTMGASKADLEILMIGGRLHDIGKIGIRDDVLFKPGPLTTREFELIKQHPIIGANILKAIPSLAEIIPIVLYHHERMDGKGYPQALKGPDIPLWARLTAVADTCAALMSTRPYHDAKPQEYVLQVITAIRGTQLCPDCVDMFLQWFTATDPDKLRQILRR